MSGSGRNGRSGAGAASPISSMSPSMGADPADLGLGAGGDDDARRPTGRDQSAGIGHDARSPSGASAATGAMSLVTAADSPVSAASCARRPRASISRRSAGTRSPASSRTTSPGTSSSPGTVIPRAVAQHRRLGREHAAHRGQRVLRAPLLPEADGGVEHDDGEDHRRVRPVSKQRRHRAGRDQHVDQHIVELTDDALKERPPRGRRQRVRAVLREPPSASAPSSPPAPVPSSRRTSPASRACQSSEAPGSAIIGLSPPADTVARSY